MTEENDPFSMLTEEEGMSSFAKFCIFGAVFLLIFVLYLNGSGTSESYKQPPVSQDFSIEGLESQELSFEELDEYNENKKKAKEQKLKEESAPPVAKTPETSNITAKSQTPDAPQSSISASVPPAAAPSGLVVPDEIEKNAGAIASDVPNAVDVAPAPSTPTVPEIAPVTPKPEKISYDDVRQPIPSKENWKAKLPNFETLVDVQRMTPIDNLEYSAKFNDNVGAITISQELGKPWYYFRRLHTEKKPNASKIAVVVYGLGINAKNTMFAINSLPAEVTTSFSVYTPDLKMMVKNARMAGHETMLDLPLQSENYPLIDPGSLGMLQNVTPGDNMKKLINILSQDIPFIGFFSTDGEAVSVSVPSITVLTTELMKRGLILLDGNSKSIIPEFKKFGAQKTTVVIDKSLFKEQILKAFDDAKQQAITNGTAIIAIDSQLLSIYLLRDFINEEIIPDQSIELVPVSLLFNP